jgi:hypothetical protein
MMLKLAGLVTLILQDRLQLCSVGVVENLRVKLIKGGLDEPL